MMSGIPLLGAWRVAAVLAMLTLPVACSKDGKAAAPASTGAASAPGGASAARNASGAGRRVPPTITLAASDVATLTLTTIEDGAALTGDLRPIETIDVRSRIEGDLTGVYAREGQQVAIGELLARFESSEQESTRRSAEADRVAAQSELANATWTLEQNSSLFKAGAIAQQDMRISQQQLSTARARLAAADARVRLSGNQSRDTRVLAPTSGIIEKRLVESGEHVARGAPLFTLVRNGTLELAASVPSRLATAVRVGQMVRFVADGRRLDGRIARISPTIDPATRSITVYVQVANPGGVLRGGTFATGRVVSQMLPSVLAVPVAALRQSPETGRPFVYRIDGKAMNPAPVRIGVVDERAGLAQVTDGLQVGDRVIVGNVGTLGRGMLVSIAGEGKEKGRPESRQ